MAGGRYRLVNVSLWGSSDFHQLGRNARLLYLALATGSSSSFAGIGRYYVEALVVETELSPAEIENAFLELEKRPTRGRSFIVRDRHRGLVWVRDQLRNDPARDNDVDIENKTVRKGIFRLLGDLPKDSPVVQKFKRSYKLVSSGPHDTPGWGPRGGVEAPNKSPNTNKNKIPNTNKKAPWGPNEAPPPARPGGGAPAAPLTQAQIDVERRRFTETLCRQGMSERMAKTFEVSSWPGRLAHYEKDGTWPPDPPPAEPTAEASRPC